MTDPTLKIRVKLEETTLGADCTVMAERVVGSAGEVIDAKWGRDPVEWAKTGKGWGRQRLSDRDAGFIEAVRLSGDDPVAIRLIEIIDRMTTR